MTTSLKGRLVKCTLEHFNSTQSPSSSSSDQVHDIVPLQLVVSRTELAQAEAGCAGAAVAARPLIWL